MKKNESEHSSLFQEMIQSYKEALPFIGLFFIVGITAFVDSVGFIVFLHWLEQKEYKNLDELIVVGIVLNTIAYRSLGALNPFRDE